MEFRRLLNRLKGVLPKHAIHWLPLSLSRHTQRQLCSLTDKEAGIILLQVIDSVDHGLTERIDSLTQKAIRNNNIGADKKNT